MSVVPKKSLVIPIFLILLGIVFIIVGSKNTYNFDSSTSNNLVQEDVASPSTKLVSQPDRQKVKVARVIDGDTIEIDGGQKVRYIGIDTPETVDPNRPDGCFGKEASDENKKLLENKSVYLDKDISDKDKFGRLLRYVYLDLGGEKTLFINDYLVKNGYARAKDYPPDTSMSNLFSQDEMSAKAQKLGLWGKCN